MRRAFLVFLGGVTELLRYHSRLFYSLLVFSFPYFGNPRSKNGPHIFSIFISESYESRIIEVLTTGPLSY